MNQEDLKNLKAGDQIAISGWYSMSLQTIKNITPTGRIKTMDGKTYNNLGRSTGEEYHHSYICTVEEYNQEEERKRIMKERAKLLYEIDEICINKNISVENLRIVLNILKE